MYDVMAEGTTVAEAKDQLKFYKTDEFHSKDVTGPAGNRNLAKYWVLWKVIWPRRARSE